MSDGTKTLYERLGGYEAIAAVANDLLPRLRADPQLGRFWAHRGEDGIMREKQLLIDFLCASAGGPTYYRGRDMLLTHRGMRISESDWNVFLGHAAATLAKFQVPEAEQRDVVPPEPGRAWMVGWRGPHEVPRGRNDHVPSDDGPGKRGHPAARMLTAIEREAGQPLGSPASPVGYIGRTEASRCRSARSIIVMPSSPKLVPQSSGTRSRVRSLSASR
jgi:hemoglobin